MNNKIFSIYAFAALLLCACNKNNTINPTLNEMGDESTMTVSIAGENFSTKAALVGSESTIESLEAFVFLASGKLDAHHIFTSSEISAKKAIFKVRSGGTKTVYMVANARGSMLTGIHSAKTLTALKSCALAFNENVSSDNSVVPFMVGSNTCELTSGAYTVSVSLKRRIARITLKRITNNMPAVLGNITLNDAYLCSVPVKAHSLGNAYSIAASPATDWINLNGNLVSSSEKPKEYALTHQSITGSITRGNAYTTAKYFYSFPNSLTTVSNGTTAAGTGAVLMIEATVDGTKYYYPVSLKKALVENYNYDVELTISGYGNEAANKYDHITRAQMTATISVSDWTDGSVTQEDI